MLFHCSIPLSDVDSRPWDFQAEECALRAAVDRFNYRRYDKGPAPSNAANANAANQSNSSTAGHQNVRMIHLISSEVIIIKLPVF